MDQSRIAEIKAVGYGSGCRITPRLVLTSGHVCGSIGDLAKIRFLQNDEIFEGRVVWQRHDSQLDAALVELSHELRPPHTSLRLGRFTGGSRGASCEIWGFPAGVAREFRDVVQLSGTINPGTQQLGGRHRITLTDAIPHKGVPQGESPWQGLSGGPVFSEQGMLVGVVEHDPVEYDSDALEVVPLAELIRDDEFRGILGRHLGHRPRVESVELSGLVDRAEPPPVRSPGFLLRAEAEAVRFRGRTELLEDLTRWCDGDGVAVRLLTGPGGSGKTRLARQLMGTLPAEEWVCAAVARGRVAESGARTLAATQSPVLLVVDYAETRVQDVQALLEAALDNPARTPVRILLIARSAGDWWEELSCDSNAGLVLCTAAPITKLDELEPTRNGRRAAYAQALGDLARLVGRATGDETTDWTAVAASLPAPDLPIGAPVSVLTLHVTALAALLQAGPRPAEVGPGVSAAEILLLHEARYWRHTARTQEQRDLDPEIVRRCVAAVALCGADDEASGRALLSRVPGLRDASEATVTSIVRWMSALYPVESGVCFGSLQPDLLGELLIGKVVAKSGEFLPSLVPAGTADQVVQALHVLTRACSHQPHVAAALIRLVRDRPGELAPAAVHVVPRTERPGPLVAALEEWAGQPEADLEQARRIERLIPRTTSFLSECAVRLAGRICTATLRERSEPPTVVGVLTIVSDLMRWAARLAGVGQSTKAALISGRAMGLISTQVKETRNWKTPAYHSLLQVLLSTVTQHADHLWQCGEKETAVRRGRESLAFARDLARVDESGTGSVGVTLVALAAWLQDSGEYAEAEAYAREAVDVFRRLAAEAPAQRLPALARAEMTLGDVLAAAGRAREADRARQEAIARFGEVGSADSDDRIALAIAHAQAARSFEIARRPDEADLAWRRSADVSRALAETDPDGGLRYFVQTQRDFADYLARVGDRQQAVEELEQAVNAARRLVHANRRSHLADFAEVMLKLVLLHHRAGRTYRVGTLLPEGVAVFRELIATDSGPAGDQRAARLDKYRSGLGLMLRVSGEHLTTHRRTEEAATALLESVGIWADPLEWSANHAEMAVYTLEQLVRCQPGREVAEPARDLALQITARMREDAIGSSPGHERDLFVRSLLILGSLRQTLDAHVAAMAVCEEAEALVRSGLWEGESSYLLVRTLTLRTALCGTVSEDPRARLAVTGAATESAYQAAATYARQDPGRGLGLFEIIAGQAIAFAHARAIFDPEDTEKAAGYAKAGDALRVLTDVSRAGAAAQVVAPHVAALVKIGSLLRAASGRSAFVQRAIEVYESLSLSPDAPPLVAIELQILTCQLAKDQDYANAWRAAMVMAKRLQRTEGDTAERREDAGIVHLIFVLSLLQLPPNGARTTEALDAMTELLPLITDAPEEYLRTVAPTLAWFYLGDIRKSDDQERRALWAAGLVQLARGLPEQEPHDQRGALAAALADLARMQTEARQYEQAEPLLAEAADILGGLADENPANYLAAFLTALGNLVSLLQGMRRTVSVELWERWAAAHRRNAEADPERRELISVLRRASVDLARREEGEALKFCWEWEQVCADVGDQPGSCEAGMLRLSVLAKLERYPETVELGQQLLPAIRELAGQQPREWESPAAQLAGNLVVAHFREGDFPTAARLDAEAAPALLAAAADGGEALRFCAQTALLGAQSLARLERWPDATERLIDLLTLTPKQPDAAADDASRQLRNSGWWELRTVARAAPEVVRGAWRRRFGSTPPDWLFAEPEQAPDGMGPG